MSVPIIIFHHACFLLGDPPTLSDSALQIGIEQMEALKNSGLLEAASEFHVGLNGGTESEFLAQAIFPEKAQVKYHGLSSKSENLTLVMIEDRLKTIDGEAYIFYQHQKGSSHAQGSDYSSLAGRWRHRMMFHCVTNWHQCVADLESGFEAVGAHWLTGQGWDHSQHYFAGNQWAARASYLKTLPSIFLRERIKNDGISALSSRYESEVWIGNGARLPKIRSYYNGAIGT